MMIPSAQLLIAAATAFVGVGQLPDDGEQGERGPVTAQLLRAAGCPTDGSWSTAFVHHVGYWSHFDHGEGSSAWPLPPMADANALARFAADRGIERIHPAPYDLFTLWSPARKEFTRAGIILSVGASSLLPDGTRYHECITIEGDSSDRLGAGGKSIKRARRFLSSGAGDCFVRWLDLAALAALAAEGGAGAGDARLVIRRAA